MIQDKVDIGSWVLVKARMVCSRAGCNRKWTRIPCPKLIVGRISGKARKFSGTVKVEVTKDDIYEPEVRYLDITQSHLFYTVIRGWSNKPIYVRAEDLELLYPENMFLLKGEFPQLYIKKQEK